LYRLRRRRPGQGAEHDEGNRVDLSKIQLFGAFKSQLDWAVERQQALAQNVANADTPGYRPMDVKRPEFKDFLAKGSGPVKLALTHPRHLAARSPDTPRSRWEPDAAEAAPSGNAVDLEEQMLKVRDTSGTFNLMLNLMRKHVNFIKLAVRRAR